MTPEQIERLQAAVEVWPAPWEQEDIDELRPILRALLAEWEERGREVESLKHDYGIELRDAAAEVERLSEQLQLCTVPDGWETWRRNAEAEIERLKADLEVEYAYNVVIGDLVKQRDEAEARLAEAQQVIREGLHTKCSNCAQLEARLAKLQDALVAASGSPKDRDRMDEVIPLMLAGYRARGERAEARLAKVVEALEQIRAAAVSLRNNDAADAANEMQRIALRALAADQPEEENQ